jgi:hypothetical protein
MSTRIVRLLPFLALGACAGGPDLTGTWAYNAGTVTLDCGGGDSTTEPLGGNISIVAGTSADLVLVGQGCNLEFDATDDGAEIRAGQSCTFESQLADGTRVIVTLIPITWTFTASEDGETLTEMTAASVAFAYPDQTVTCSLVGMGTLGLVGR